MINKKTRCTSDLVPKRQFLSRGREENLHKR